MNLFDFQQLFRGIPQNGMPVNTSAALGRHYDPTIGNPRASSAGYTTSSPGWRRDTPFPAAPPDPRQAVAAAATGASGAPAPGPPATTSAIDAPQQGPPISARLPENVANATSPSSLGDMLSPGQATSPSSLGGMLYPGQMTSPSSAPGFLSPTPAAGTPLPPSPFANAPIGSIAGPQNAPIGSIAGPQNAPIPPPSLPIPGAQGQPPAPQTVTGAPTGPLPPEITQAPRSRQFALSRDRRGKRKAATSPMRVDRSTS